MQLLAGLVFCVVLFSPALVAGEGETVAVTPKTGEKFDPTTATIPADKTNYLVMMDAGSSGTRVRAFKYGTVGTRLVVQPFLKGGKQFDEKPVGPMHKWATVAAKGVIDATGKKAIADNIQVLVTKAKEAFTAENVSADKQKAAYIVLQATAGMRTLPGNARNAIMREARAALRNSGFKTVGRRTAYVLPGEDEGLFTWLTINYLKDTLTADNDEKIDAFYQKEEPTQKAVFQFKSTAVVEMGGASTQVAFIAGSEPLAHSYHYNVDDLDLTLYATSYMNFGNDAARRNMVKGAGTENPCGVTGVPVEGVPSKWDQAKCDAAIKQHSLLMEEKCTQPSCAFDGRYMPRIPAGQKIALVGAFTKAAGNLGCLTATDKIECLNTNSIALCNAGSKEAAVKMITDTWKVTGFNGDYLADVCFQARYSYLLLTTGLKLKGTTEAPKTPQVEFMEKLSNTNIGWEYGAAIYVVKMLERFERRRQTLKTLGVIKR
jgi:hypothetical protein